MRNFDRMIQKMGKAAQPFEECRAKLSRIKELEAFTFQNPEEMIATLHILGVPLVEVQDRHLALETTFTPWERQRFCIVDIETNGSKPSNAQIIEIGALLFENGKIVDTFESFVHAQEIPSNIVELTQITLEDLVDAPNIKNVLEKFRLFLQDAVFVAHNVNFDYGFISFWMEKVGFGPLLNRKICSIDLARKCIQAPRYGLAYLIEHFDLKVDQHHRALSDAKAASEVFQLSLEKLPQHVISTEDLIHFAKPNQKKRKTQEAKNQRKVQKT